MSKTSFPNDDPHDDQKPKLEDYTLGETLGRGTFGKVKLGTHKITSQKVAIKILEKSKLGDPDFQKRVNREIKILKDFCHPNVINIYQVIETQNEFYMIMEYINGGELSDYIAAKKKLNEDEACRIFRQIISAIEDLHKNGIAHRDLKPENILLDSDRNVKIIDFGLSNTYKPGEMLKTACGSPCYAAPEMIAGKPYHGLETDIWSCGITLFLMICGQLPFDDKNTSRLYKKILEDDLAISKLVSPEARDLLKNVLNKDPVKRFTVKQIVEHAWYKGQKFPPQLQQSTSNEVIIRNLEDYGVEVNESKDPAKENKVTRLSNLYHLLHQTQLKKGEKPEKAKNAHNSLVTTTKKIEDESSPYANIMKANSIALRSRAMDSVKTPKGSEQIHERMNSLDRSIASDKNKAGPYTSLEKIIEKEKVSIKSPRVIQQETSGRADISQQKMQLKTSFLSQINDFKDAVNLVSTRATSNTSDDTKRPKTERERKNITYFPLAKTQSQKEKSSVNDKSLTNCGKPESIDSDRGRTPIVVVGADNINLSYRALSNEKNGEASSLNSISNSNDLNEDIKNPYGLFKPGSLKEASSPQSATHKNTKSNAMYNSMRNALKSNYITSLVTNKKIDVPNPVKEARSKERLTIESILPDTGSPVGNKPIRSFLKQSQNSTINDVKRLINNSFGPKVLGPEEPHSTNYQTVLDVPKPSLEIIPVTTTVKRNSKHQNLLTWKQFDSKITQRQNQSLLVSAKENSTKKSDQNTTLTSIIKQLPEELSGVQTMKESRRRNTGNTPTKVGDISLSDKFKGTALWPSPSVVPCDEEQQTRLYNKFRKHMINM